MPRPISCILVCGFAPAARFDSFVLDTRRRSPRVQLLSLRTREEQLDFLLSTESPRTERRGRGTSASSCKKASSTKSKAADEAFHKLDCTHQYTRQEMSGIRGHNGKGKMIGHFAMPTTQHRRECVLIYVVANSLPVPA